MLELITLGIYRFWLATDIRRHLWHHTSVDGDALEYTGVPKELLYGGLLALGIFAPIYLIYFILGIEAERQQAFASVPFGLFFYLFSQFAFYRARRYRTTRTIWRGVRFWMTGSGWNYAARSFGWYILLVLTLGLILPWRDASLERYKMRNSHYGDLQGHFDGTGWEFFKQGIWLWLVLMAAIVTPAIELAIRGAPAISGLYSYWYSFWVLTIGAPFIYAAFKAIQWRWWVSGSRFGDVSFASTIRAKDLFGIYWKVVGWFFLIFVLVVAAITAIVTADAMLYAGGGTAQQKFMIASQQLHVIIASIVCYVVGALLATAVVRIYLIHDIAARVAAATTVHNVNAAENVAARGQAANAVGEGLADSLDLSFGF